MLTTTAIDVDEGYSTVAGAGGVTSRGRQIGDFHPRGGKASRARRWKDCWRRMKKVTSL